MTPLTLIKFFYSVRECANEDALVLIIIRNESHVLIAINGSLLEFAGDWRSRVRSEGERER